MELNRVDVPHVYMHPYMNSLLAIAVNHMRAAVCLC